MNCPVCEKHEEGNNWYISVATIVIDNEKVSTADLPGKALFYDDEYVSLQEVISELVILLLENFKYNIRLEDNRGEPNGGRF